MIDFEPISDTEPALVHSPLLTAALLTLGYIEANGPIGLTPSKALKRYFVTWAAEEFAWPYYTAPELYDMNKVLNEQDFLPLMVLHDVLLSAKLVRHYKGAMHITNLGKQFKSRPAVLWIMLATHLLCVLDSSQYARFEDQFAGDWDVLLAVINAEAEVAVTDKRLCSLIFGISEKDMLRDYRLSSMLYLHVLRPLAWAGLLDELRQGRGFERSRMFVKTPLWAAALPFAPPEHVARPTIQ